MNPTYHGSPGRGREYDCTLVARGDVTRWLSPDTIASGNARLTGNLVLALVYDAADVPLAAGAFYPLFGWPLSPMFAAAAMSLGSVSVIANALRPRAAEI